VKLSRSGSAVLTVVYMIAIFVLSSLHSGLPGVLGTEESSGFVRDVSVLLSNLLHVPLYGGLAFLVHRTVATRGTRYEPSRGTVLAALGFVLVYSVFDEVHQSFTPGRIPSGFDVTLNMIGAGLALGIERRSLRRFVVPGFLLAAAAVGVAATGARYSEAESRIVRTIRQWVLPVARTGRISGFGRASEWEPIVPERGTFPVEVTREHATEGPTCLRVEFPAALEFSAVRSKSIPVDWSSFGSVRFDVFHAGDAPVDLEVRVHDYRTRVFRRALRVEPGGRTVVVSLDGIDDAIDARGVRSFQIFVPGPLAAPLVLFFDDLRVTRRTADAPGSGQSARVAPSSGPRPIAREGSFMRPASLAITLALLAAVGIPPGAALGGDRVVGEPFATRSPVLARRGMVASAHPLATLIGIETLRKGGNAVDAALAVNAALGFLEPTSCGVGGDLFAIVWSARERKLYGLDASGRSPASLSYDRLVEALRGRGAKGIPLYDALAVSTPGAVSGWIALHEKFGSLPLGEILAPAIAAAEAGEPLPQLIAHYFGIGVQRYAEYPEWGAVYAKPDGNAYTEGDLFRNPLLAETYRRIARDGWRGFYEGETARAVEAVVRKYGGFLRAEDLARQKARWVTPVSVDYRGFDVWELPPQGQGIAALQMLRMLAPFDLASMGRDTPETLHLLIEVKKIAYEDRARFYADPDFASVPVDRLLSPDYARKRLELFDPRRASLELPAGDPGLERGETTYLCVVDENRNAVSLIQSNYAGFGSGLVPAGCGFTLQNRGALFSLEPGHPNVYAPGKHPFHTIIPAMVTKEGRPVFVFGVMGGAMQPQGHVQVLVNLLDHGMNVQEAGDAPRFRHGGSSQPTDERMTDGGVVYLESGIPPGTVFALERIGHKIGTDVGGFGGYQGIRIDWERGILEGGSESRKDGAALGY